MRFAPSCRAGKTLLRSITTNDILLAAMQSDDDDESWDDVTTTMPKRHIPLAGVRVADKPHVITAEHPVVKLDEIAAAVVPDVPFRPDKPGTSPNSPPPIVSDLAPSWNSETEILPAQVQARLDKQPALPFRPAVPGVAPVFEPEDDWADHTKPLGNVLEPPHKKPLPDEPTGIFYLSPQNETLPFKRPHVEAPPVAAAPPPSVITSPRTEELSSSAVFPAPSAVFPVPTPSSSSSNNAGPAPEIPPVANVDRVRLVHDSYTSVALLPWVIDGVRHMRTVVVKWTADIVPEGTCTLRSPADALHSNVFRDADPGKSLVAASDFVPRKTHVDVTLVGHAFAPGGAAEAALVSFSFGSREAGGFERRMMVFGERRFERVHDVGTGPGKPLLFRQVPLIYELAFGGAGSRENPVGLGRDRGLAPQLEDPERLVHRPLDAISPMCFAPIAPDWPVRWVASSRVGTGQTSSGRVTLAADFDASAYQAAPKPQRIAAVRGDESFTMTGMHANRSTITGFLPGVIARCFFVRQGSLIEIESKLDTIAFDMDALKVNLVLRGSFEVATENASEIEAVFVMMEPALGPHRPLADVLARYLQFVAR